MNEILRFVQGKITYDEFEVLLLTNPEIWDLVQSLLTDEMKARTNHPCFTYGNWQRLQANNFSVKGASLSFDYDSNKSVIHSLFSDLVEYHYPDIHRKTPTDYSPASILTRLSMDYLGGEEVDKLIEQVLSEPVAGNARERAKAQKERLRNLFHLIPRKIPQWAQSEDWPMGTNSPMEFVSQKKAGERVEYKFRDVDTGAERTIVQLY